MNTTVEGSLDILWENNDQPAATPKYRLHFLRYANFKSGSQPSKLIVGSDGLESYLIELGFAAADAKNWVKQLHEKRAVLIPNVRMPVEHMAVYEQAS